MGKYPHTTIIKMLLTEQKCSCCDDTVNVLELEAGLLGLLDPQENKLVLLLDEDELKELVFTLTEKVCRKTEKK